MTYNVFSGTLNPTHFTVLIVFSVPFATFYPEFIPHDAVPARYV